MSSLFKKSSSPAFQFASKVLMVRPTNFFLNAETFEDNKFMHQVNESQSVTTKKAQTEFDGFVDMLKENKVDVEVYHQIDKNAPDSVFPNNWFSTHKLNGGLFSLYPMHSPSREIEKNPAIIDKLKNKYSNFLDIKAQEVG